MAAWEPIRPFPPAPCYLLWKYFEICLFAVGTSYLSICICNGSKQTHFLPQCFCQGIESRLEIASNMMSPDYCLALLYIFLSLYSIHNKDLHWIHNQLSFQTVRIATLVLVTTLFLFLNTVIRSRLQVLPWILKCGSSVVLESQFHQKMDVKSRLRKISMNDKPRVIFHANETICIITRLRW